MCHCVIDYCVFFSAIAAATSGTPDVLPKSSDRSNTVEHDRGSVHTNATLMLPE